ncbi:YqaA family protein [Thiomicrorhabdus aquaedulcis]|uniref:YqaA family protein n=1 Tax=Thiomicrorhabdus aquaedulcis TaxID=2211106 RepID=UPI000FDCC706|nr:YqaA family protein [Thiomicrorhabdus aquaedulcis]
METWLEFGMMGLFLASFLAATILPLGSEVVLSVLLLNGLDPVSLVAVATLGNVLGSLTNYALGFWGGTYLVSNVLKVPPAKLESAQQHFKTYGTWSLLLAWVPVIGDPLTVVAGLLKVNIGWFLLLVTVGKLARYIVVAFVTLSPG